VNKRFNKNQSLLYALLLIISRVSAQDTLKNLLLNPSFELSTVKSGNFRNKDDVEFETHSPHWTTIRLGSPDIIDSMQNYIWHEYDDMVTPRIKPHDGAKVAGIRLYGCRGNNYIDCREYLVQKLEQPLIKGHYYHFELWTARLPQALACNDLAVYFSDTLLDKRYFLPDLKLKPQIKCKTLPGGRPLYWYKMADTIKADKDYMTVYIGSFVNDKWAIVDKIEEKSFKQSYYLIDDIKLFDLGTTKYKTIPNRPVAPPYKVNVPFVLKNLFFEFDKETIIPASYPDLDTLAMHLIANPSLKLKISGHTDNVGADKFNQNLSEKRAFEVSKYLQNKGILRERLTAQGFGETQPIADNTSEEGRQLNRRVEFVLIQN
jgi:OmpA-OmpF porin, OOP family